MIVVPVDIPVTRPLLNPTVATEVVVLLQVPPGVASLNAVVAATQIVVAPVIGDSGLTVIVLETIQPVPSE